MMTTMMTILSCIGSLLIVRAGVSGAAERELQVRGRSQPAGEGRGCNKTTSRVSHQEAFRNPLPSANRAGTGELTWGPDLSDQPHLSDPRLHTQGGVAFTHLCHTHCNCGLRLVNKLAKARKTRTS